MNDNNEKYDEQEKVDEVIRAGIAGASIESAHRYGAAIKEHIVAYTGQDNEIGKQLEKSLKSISKERVNPEYRHQNLKQQAGFTAEVKETANVNAEKIIHGDTSRKIRTDDLGRVNDPLFDHVEIDASGNIIAGSGAQMKFVESSPQEAFNKLTSKKFAKYLENDAKIEVPSDYYDGILQEANNKIAKIQKQIEVQRLRGNSEQVEALSKKIDDCKKLKRNLRKSTVSNDEAMFARLHPGLSTAQSVTNIAHRAGMETAKYGAAIGGSVSIVQNLIALANGDENLDDAALGIAKDTATATAVAYSTGFAGSVIKGSMQNAKSKYISALAETSFPTLIVTTGLEVTHVLQSYFRGEINETQVVEQLGEKGVSSLAASYGAVVGTAVLPGVGTVVGSIVGYMMSSLIYGSCLQIMQEADMAYDNYLATKEMCEAAREAMHQQRIRFENQSNNVLIQRQKVFDSAMISLMNELENTDTTHFTTALSAIANEFGKELQFRNRAEFDAFMNDSDTVFKF
ncbi:MAG: hypothetical protein SO072_00420 [Dysosmobacter sp.]|nr:hypothetical protein [Dysosmobacter sp.]